MFVVFRILLLATIAGGLFRPLFSEELRPLDEALKSDLQELLEERCRESTFRGLSYSIAIPGYEVWTGTYGDLGGAVETPVTRETTFGIASITKTYVAAIVFQLRDEGLIDFDRTVESYLGKISNVSENVTVRHLLSMTSGIYNFSSPAKNAIGAAVANKAAVWSPREMLEDYLSPTQTEPGTRYQYSNTNYVLLGMIIEEVTGEAFVDVLHERLLEPYSLENTLLGGFDSLPEELALTDYTRDGVIDPELDAAQASISRLFWTSGGMFATSEDLVLWGKALYGGEVLGQQSLAEMVDFAANGFSEYGMGAMPDSHLGYTFWGHGGLLSYAGSLAYSPDTGITLGFAASMDRMFGTINYWPHDDMFAVLREHGIEQQIAVDINPIQFTNTDSVEYDLRVARGLPLGLVEMEVGRGPASLEGGALRLGMEEGAVEFVVRLGGNEFYRGDDALAIFEVYSRFGDEDGDGVENALESLLGRDVLVVDTWRGVTLRKTDAGFGIEILRARGDIPYLLERSSDLVNWEEQGDGLAAGAFGGRAIWVPLGDAATMANFLRVKLR